MTLMDPCAEHRFSKRSTYPNLRQIFQTWAGQLAATVCQQGQGLEIPAKYLSQGQGHIRKKSQSGKLGQCIAARKLPERETYGDILSYSLNRSLGSIWFCANGFRELI